MRIHCMNIFIIYLMFFPAAPHFSLAVLVSAPVQGHAMAGTHPRDANHPAGIQASVSVLEILHPITGVCTPGFVFSSMLLKTPFKSPSTAGASFHLLSAWIYQIPPCRAPHYGWPISSSTSLRFLFPSPSQIRRVFGHI